MNASINIVDIVKTYIFGQGNCFFFVLCILIVHIDRRSGESSSHSRSSGHRERERHHRSSGEERVRGERRVESRSSHGERRSHRTVREEKRKSRKRYMCTDAC